MNHKDQLRTPLVTSKDAPRRPAHSEKGGIPARGTRETVPRGRGAESADRNSRSEAEELAGAIAAAIDPEKSRPKQLTPEQEEGLYAYYTGKRPLPESPEHRARILHRIALYQRDVLQPRHLREYGAEIDRHFKTSEGKDLKERLSEFERRKKALQDKYRPEGRTRFDEELWPQAYFEELEALNQRLFAQDDGTLKQLIPLGLPYRPDRTQADDLPEISPVLALIIHENPEVLVEVRRSFMLALSTGIGDENSPEGKFCRVLSLLLEQGHRMYAEAGDIAKLHQLENVSLVLLTYGIVRPTVKTLSNGRAVPSFTMNSEALRQDVADFLTLERSSRTKDESGAEIQDTAVQEAVARIEARARRIGAKEARTAIEAIWGRFNLQTRFLPVFDEPQAEDGQKASARASIGKRSLDAALQVLATREDPTEQRYDPSGITERITTSSNILSRISESIVAYDQNIDTLDGLLGTADPGTQQIARALLRQITNDADAARTEVRNMRDLIARGQDKAEPNRAYREQHGGALITRAEQLITELQKLDNRLGALIYARPSETPQDDSMSEDVDTLRARAESLQHELEFTKEESADHIAALNAFQSKISSLLKHMSDGGSRRDIAREQIVIKMRLKAALDGLEAYLKIITTE